MNVKTSWQWGAALTIALLLAPVSSTLAQTSPARGRVQTRVSVTIALVERLPVPDAPFVLVRRPDANPGDVILLPAEATAEVLSAALTTLLTVRQTRGDRPEESGIVRLVHGSGQPRPRARLPWAAQVLADLRRAPVRQVEGFGSVPAVEVWLPRQGRR